MPRIRHLAVPRLLSVSLLSLAAIVSAQAPSGIPATPGMPRDYRGVQVRVSGIFVTPVPNAPFSASVEIVSHSKLADGTEHVVTTKNQIARTSSGKIYNERRGLVSPQFKGDPALLSAHIYDPATRLSIYLFPMTRLARESVLPAPPAVPADAMPPGSNIPPPGLLHGTLVGPVPVETALGSHILDGVELLGFKRERTLPADRSGTGQPLTIVDEYWYSPALSIYCVIRHQDPRSGEQLVAVTSINRGEPSPDLFRVSDDYKVVDETPLPRTPANTRPR